MDEEFQQSLREFAADAGGTLAKGIAATAVVGGTAAALAGGGTGAMAVAGAGAVALSGAAVMEQDNESCIIKNHQAIEPIPDEGITIRMDVVGGGDHNAPAPAAIETHPACNEVTQSLANTAMGQNAGTERPMEHIQSRLQELMPAMQSMGIQLQDCGQDESTHHGCAAQTRAPRMRNDFPDFR